MKIWNLVFIMLITSLAGCTTMKTSRENSWAKTEHESAKVIVFRKSEWASKSVEAGFGSQSNYVVALKPMEYAVLSIPEGDHEFRIGSPQSVASNLSVSLSQSETACIRVKANVTPIVLAVTIPILYWAIPSFTGEIVTCPTAIELEEYKQVITEIRS